jgi:hypothetical protein
MVLVLILVEDCGGGLKVPRGPFVQLMGQAATPTVVGCVVRPKQIHYHYMISPAALLRARPLGRFGAASSAVAPPGATSKVEDFSIGGGSAVHSASVGMNTDIYLTLESARVAASAAGLTSHALPCGG